MNYLIFLFELPTDPQHVVSVVENANLHKIKSKLNPSQTY